MSAPGQVLAPYQAFLDLAEAIEQLRAARMFHKSNVAMGTCSEVGAVLDAWDVLEGVARKPYAAVVIRDGKAVLATSRDCGCNHDSEHHCAARDPRDSCRCDCHEKAGKR